MPATEAPSPDDRIVCHGVGISRLALWQYEDLVMTCRVARDDIVLCRLEHGSPEPRPLVSAVMGLVLMTPGVIVVQDAAGLLQTGAWHLEQGFDAIFLLFLGLGFWLVSRALFIRRYYLLVLTGARSRRYVFGRHATLPAIQRFVATARAQWSWNIAENPEPAREVAEGDISRMA